MNAMHALVPSFKNRCWQSFAFLFFSCFLLAAGCGKDLSPEEQSQLKGLRDSLLNSEHLVLQKVNERKLFHEELMVECMEPDSMPYPKLQSLMDAMLESHQGMRKTQHEGLMVLEQGSLALVQERREVNRKAFLDDLRMDCSERLARIDSMQHGFLVLDSAYGIELAEHEIVYLTHTAYADSLLQSIVMREQDMVQQGSAIAAALQNLKALDLAPRSEAYLAVYRPISEVQRIHKEYQAILTGINNAHARYDGARPEEGFFLGPFLAPRFDVEAMEDQFQSLDSLNTLFNHWRVSSEKL